MERCASLPYAMLPLARLGGLRRRPVSPCGCERVAELERERVVGCWLLGLARCVWLMVGIQRVGCGVGVRGLAVSPVLLLTD